MRSFKILDMNIFASQFRPHAEKIVSQVGSVNARLMAMVVREPLPITVPGKTACYYDWMIYLVKLHIKFDPNESSPIQTFERNYEFPKSELLFR
jgi:hypothetical protein